MSKRDGFEACFPFGLCGLYADPTPPAPAPLAEEEIATLRAHFARHLPSEVTVNRLLATLDATRAELVRERAMKTRSQADWEALLSEPICTLREYEKVRAERDAALAALERVERELAATRDEYARYRVETKDATVQDMEAGRALVGALDGLWNIVMHPEEPHCTWQGHSVPWWCEQAEKALVTIPTRWRTGGEPE